MKRYFPSMKHVFCASIALISVLNNTSAQSLQLREGWWHANDEVTGMAYNPDDNVIYLAGKFTNLGPVLPFGAQVDTLGQVSLGIAVPNGKVNAAVADGLGGWYIGGEFTEVGGLPRPHLAQIDVNGTVTDWNPETNGVVNALVLAQSKIFVGGDFTEVGGISRLRLAEIDPGTGAVGLWDPTANGPVHCMIATDVALLVGGQFSQTFGQTRNNIAGFDYFTAGNPLLAWNPNANGKVLTLLEVGSVIYAGGEFTNIGGQARNRAGAVSETTGLANTWNPNANGKVNKLLSANGNVIAGGAFTTIGGQTRNYIAALNSTTGVASAWNPNANGEVFSLGAFGSKILAGGSFSSIGGQLRSSIAALNTVSGLAELWNPSAGASVEFISEQAGDNFYLGGNFHSVGGKVCRYVAAMDATTGIALDWFPLPTGFVTTVAYQAGVVYVGGFFTNIDGQSRNYVASFDAVTGSLTPWDPNANNTVTSLVPDNGNIYIGGNFTQIGGEARNFISQIDINTGLATAWNPSANNTVSAMLLNGTILYVGGSFTNIGGQSRNFIGALNTSTGTATGWNPSANFNVSCLALNGTTLYAGGAFSSIGSQPRNYLAALNTVSGFATLWNPGPDAPLYTMAYANDLVFVGGDFDSFTSTGGFVPGKAAAIDADGFATGGNYWAPEFNNRASSILVLPDGVIVGGLFTSALGNYTGSRSRLASFEWGCIEPDIPTLAADLDNVCPGTSVQLSVTTGSVNDAAYWQWYTEACGGMPIGVGIFNTVTPTQTTTYYARGEGGCPLPGACAEVTVTVIPNSFETLNPIVCTEYIAPDGQVYTESGNYLATLVNAAGCDSIITIILEVNPALTTGNLNVTTLASGNPIDEMKVELFFFTPGDSFAEANQVGFTEVNGEVLFENVPAGNYHCRAVPLPSIPGQENKLVTYVGDVFNWTNSTILSLGCYETESTTINLIVLESFSGPGTAEGRVRYRTVQSGMVTEPDNGMMSVRTFVEGDPIPGVPVIISKDTASVAGPGSGNYFPFVMTLTEYEGEGLEGYYSFNNLPAGYYRADVEMAGLINAPDNEHFFTVIEPDNVSFFDLDFFVDTTDFIYITDNVFVEEILFRSNKLSAYPNPFSNRIALQSDKETLQQFDYTLMSVDGRNVKQGTRNENGFVHEFAFGELPRGIYFLRIFRNNEETTLKLIKE